MVIMFKNEYLIEIFHATHDIVIKFCNSQEYLKKENHEIFLKAFHVYLSCLKFPFTFSYSTYDSIEENEEVTITMFPAEYAINLMEKKIYESFFIILKSR